MAAHWSLIVTLFLDQNALPLSVFRTKQEDSGELEAAGVEEAVDTSAALTR